MADVEFRLLGPVEATMAGRPVELGPARQRAVLAVLLLDAGRVVAVDRLIDRVWDEKTTSQPRKVLYSYLSRLRSALSDADIEFQRTAGGYLVDADPDTVDIHRFERLLGAARTGSDAAARLREALDLWRGEPFVGLDVPWLRQEADRLVGLREAALADLRDLRLRRGDHADLIPELQAAAVAHPLDERVAGQLMLALYRAGRQADALTHYDTLRRRLADALGSDPDPTTQRLHRQLLTADQALAAPPPETAGSHHTPDTIPWDTSDFTGRDTELTALDTALTGMDHRPGTVSAVVITGGGGAGKTALAVHWAHRPTVRDTFTHGRLYLNLQGFSEHPPLTTTDALRSLLRQLGLPGAEIPSDPDQAQRLYRHTLDRRRILLILDNAADTDQVRPLLPGVPALTLVTSRHRLTGLTTHEGATQITLGRLPDHQAHTLTARLLDQPHPPATTTRLSQLCANLPLAIRLAATGYRTAHPDTRLDDYLTQLAGDRIGLLDTAADSTTAITDVLSRSIRRLPPDLVHAFGLVGLHPGPRMDIPAIAALLDQTQRQSRRIVRALAGASLLEETSPDRWAMHDLLAEYARDTTGADAHTAHTRLLAHYHDRLDAEPIDHQWINDERAALLACLQLPVDGDDFQRYALRLGDRLFDLDLYADSRHTYEALAQRAPTDSHAHATATFGIGRAAVWLDELGAEPLLRDALRRFQQLGDPRGEARTLRELAERNRSKGGHQEAVDLRALELFRRAGDLHGESDTLMALSLEAASCSDYPLARERARQALQIAQRAGSKRLQGDSHRALGKVALITGEHAASTEHLTVALDLFTEVGYLVGRGVCLCGLGDLASAAGEHDRAMDYHREALAIYLTAGERHGEAYTYLHMGKAALAMGDPAQAREHITRALRLSRELDNRAGIAFDLMGLADVQLATGEHAEAAQHYRQAAAGLADLDYPRGEAEARLGLGRALAAMGDPSEAREQLELARGLLEKIESPQVAEVRQALRELP